MLLIPTITLKGSLRLLVLKVVVRVGGVELT